MPDIDIKALWRDVREAIASRKLQREIKHSVSRLTRAHDTAIRVGAVWYAQDNNLLEAIERLEFARNDGPHGEHPLKLLYRSLRRPRHG
jgi:hypothetical protein